MEGPVPSKSSYPGISKDKSSNTPQSRSIHIDRKSTRLNSSHLVISYAVFCLKKKNNHEQRGHLIVGDEIVALGRHQLPRFGLFKPTPVAVALYHTGYCHLSPTGDALLVRIR